MSQYLKRLAERQQQGLLHSPLKDDSSNFTRGLKGSFKNLKTTGLAALGAISGNEGYLTDADISQEEGQRYAGDTQNFSDINSLGDLGDWFGYQAGQGVGSLAQMVGGGGIGGAAAKFGVKKLGQNALGGVGKTALRKAGTIGAGVGMTATSYPQQLGENVMAIREDNGGQLEEGDVPVAAVTAIAQSALDMLPVMNAFRKMGLGDKATDGIVSQLSKSPTKLRQIGRELGTGMLQEGATEAAQEVMKLAALEWVNQEKDHFTMEEFVEVMDAFAAGAAGGMVIGAGPAAVSAVKSDAPWFKQWEKDKAQLKEKAQAAAEAGDMETYADTVDTIKRGNEAAEKHASDEFSEQSIPESVTNPEALRRPQHNGNGGIAVDEQLVPDDPDFTPYQDDGFDTDLPDYLSFEQNVQKANAQRPPEAQNETTGMQLPPEQVLKAPSRDLAPFQHEGELMPRNAGDFGEVIDHSVTIDQSAHESAESPLNNLPEPTQAQKEAGNYKKGHLNFLGLPLAIENPKGSTRKGVDESGKPWESVMHAHYGYVKGSMGADGDQVDVFLGDQAANPQLPVHVVDQIDPKTGEFDEHKVMIGYPDEQSAREGYLANYDQGWQGIGGMTPMTVDAFKDWVKSKRTKKPVSELPEVVNQVESDGVPATPAVTDTSPELGGGTQPGSAELPGEASTDKETVAAAQGNTFTPENFDSALAEARKMPAGIRQDTFIKRINAVKSGNGRSGYEDWFRENYVNAEPESKPEPVEEVKPVNSWVRDHPEVVEFVVDRFRKSEAMKVVSSDHNSLDTIIDEDGVKREVQDALVDYVKDDVHLAGELLKDETMPDLVLAVVESIRNAKSDKASGTTDADTKDVAQDNAPTPLTNAIDQQFSSGKKAVVLNGGDVAAIKDTLAAVGTVYTDKPGKLFLRKRDPSTKRIVFTDMAALAKLKSAPKKLKAYADAGVELVFVDPDGKADKGLFEVVC